MQNIFKSVCRNFVQKPATSLINLAGLLALGIVLLMSLTGIYGI